MRDAWETLLEVVGESDEAGYIVQKNAAPGVPIAIRSLEDPNGVISAFDSFASY